MKKALIVTGLILGTLAVITAGILVHIRTAYGEVDSQLRLMGYIANYLGKADSEEELIAMARESTVGEYEVEEGIIVEKSSLKGRDGKDIPLVIFRSGESRPGAIGLLYIHGGGYVMGTPDSELDRVLISDLIQASETVVISPDYTLSYEAPYPAALHDCYDTLLWMKENAHELGIDDSRLFVAGGSAGGGLTAATALYARDRGEVNIAFQMPLYPMIDDRMDLPSASREDTLIWNAVKNRIGWNLYLGDLFQSDNVPPYAAPLRETDFSGLPPAFTFVGDQDPFHDETVRYVEALKADGVNVEFFEYPGAYHGFEMIVPGAEVSKLASQRLITAYKFAGGNFKAEQK